MKWPIFRFERFKNNIAKLIKIKIANKFNILLLNLHLINERSCIFCEKLQIIASLIQLAYLLAGFSIRITVSFLPLFKKTYPRNQVSLLSYNVRVSRFIYLVLLVPLWKFLDWRVFLVLFHTVKDFHFFTIIDILL